LLNEGAEHDLLVLGCGGGSRLGGAILGSTVIQVAHRTEQALLVARRSADGSALPQGVLLAADGPAGSWAAARVAMRVAEAQGAELCLAYVPDGAHPEHYREVLKQISVIEKSTGVAALIHTPGPAAERIIETARAGLSSLIAIEDAGCGVIKPLGGVSERVVHHAPGSVLRGAAQFC
jgi:nucleotide-binding universal stress UspA family protein